MEVGVDGDPLRRGGEDGDDDFDDTAKVKGTCERVVTQKKVYENRHSDGTFVLSTGDVVQGFMPVAAWFVPYDFTYAKNCVVSTGVNDAFVLSTYPTVNRRGAGVPLHVLSNIVGKVLIATQCNGMQRVYINVMALMFASAERRIAAAAIGNCGHPDAAKFAMAYNALALTVEKSALVDDAETASAAPYIAAGLIPFFLKLQAGGDVVLRRTPLKTLLKFVRQAIDNPESVLSGVVVRRPPPSDPSASYTAEGDCTAGHAAETSPDYYRRISVSVARGLDLARRILEHIKRGKGFTNVVPFDADGAMDDIDEIRVGAKRSIGDVLGVKRRYKTAAVSVRFPTEAPPTRVSDYVPDDRTMLLSTDSLKTRIVLPPLHTIPPAIWVVHYIKERCVREAVEGKHTVLECDQIDELLKDVLDNEAFYFERTPQLFWEAVRHGTLRGILALWCPEWFASSYRPSTLSGFAKKTWEDIRDTPELRVARNSFLYNEIRVADLIEELRQRIAPPVDEYPSEAEMHAYYDEGIDPSPKQYEAFSAMLHDSVMIINGQAGSGKTTTLRAALRMIRNHNPECIVVLANNNTTVAAMRQGMGDVMPETPVECKWDPMTQDSEWTPGPYVFYMTCAMFIIKSGKKGHPCANPEFVVFEEAAMVGAGVFGQIAHIIGPKKNPKLKSLIMCGDPRQLPSIEYGDIFACLMRSGIAVTLDRNYRATSKVLVDNLMAIRDRDPSRLEADDAVFPDCRIAVNGDEVLNRRYRQHTEEFSRRVMEIVRQLSPKGDPDDIRKIRVLCPYGNLAQYLSAQMKAYFFGAAISADDCWTATMTDRPPARLRNRPFFVGEPTVATETDLEIGLHKGKLMEIRFMFYLNGALPQKDIAELYEMSKPNQVNTTHAPRPSKVPSSARFYVVFDNDVILSMNSPRELHKFVRSGLASTVYSAQGAEYDNVILVVPTGRLSDSQTIYCGASRAKKCVYYVADENTFLHAIRTPPPRRRTILGHLIGAPPPSDE